MPENCGNDSDLPALASAAEVRLHGAVVAEKFIRKLERYPHADPAAIAERKAARARLGSDYGQDS